MSQNTATTHTNSAMVAQIPGLDPAIVPAIADRLQADAHYYYLIHTLRRILPGSPGESPEHLARRDNAIIARIAALQPANPIEADIAADYVAASEHARDCLRITVAPETSPQWALKCRAQANTMMRQAYAALSRLERMQAERRKLEKNPEVRDRDAWAEHCVIGLMTQAMAEQPAQTEADLLAELEPADERDPESLTPEQQRATIHRNRAALIRRIQQALNDSSFTEHVAQAYVAERHELSAQLYRTSLTPSPCGRGQGEGAALVRQNVSIS